jgi:carnitine 3-dehydrogenase
MSAEADASASDRSVAIVGAGTIGVGWGIVFASKGWRVRLFDVDTKREVSAMNAIRTALGNEHHDLLNWSQSLEEALAGVAFVQESLPDYLEVKRPLLEAVSRRVEPDVPIASSTSVFKPTDLQRGLVGHERILVGHPFHPVHLLPLVEVVGGRTTDPAIVARTVRLYESVGKTVIALKSEITGHLVNRLQAALIREAIHLVSIGAVSVHDVDRGLAYAPALRWPITGLFLTLHLAGGTGGGREYLEKLGQSLQLMWDDLGDPRMSPETRELIARQLEEYYSEQTVEHFATERDRLLELLANTIAKAGRLV